MFLLCMCLTFLHVDGYQPIVKATQGRPWPLPQKEQPHDGFAILNSHDFRFEIEGHDCKILQNAFKRYQKIIFELPFSRHRFTHSKQLENPENKSSDEKCFKFHSNMVNYDYCKIFSSKNHLPSLKVDVQTPCEEYPDSTMNEEYELQICTPERPCEANLISRSIWGALRGLETFSQLIIHRDSNLFAVNCTSILDFPSYLHRGVLLDTSRHFLPMSKIRETLELMAMNKFNVFHWHIVDDQSFPYQSDVYPDLSAKGAWDNNLVYSSEDITSIVDFASNLGIRVIAEFDTPDHCHSWEAGRPGFMTPCYSNGVPNGEFGPVDPSKEENFIFLKNFFEEVSTRFRDDFLHLGGDEVLSHCWRSNPDIQKLMKNLNFTSYEEVEEYYVGRLIKIVSEEPINKRYIVWDDLFYNVDLPKDAIVQVWVHRTTISSVTHEGYHALLSACWYLNFMAENDWKDFYSCDPRALVASEKERKLVLGGEACLWGEYVDETNLTPILWPRASAVSERLWSPVKRTLSPNNAAPRLEEHRCRMRRRGYEAAPINGPSFCKEVSIL